MENQQLLQVQDGDKLLQAVLHSRISDKGVEVETVNGWEHVLIPVSTVWLDIKPAYSEGAEAGYEQGYREAGEAFSNNNNNTRKGKGTDVK